MGAPTAAYFLSSFTKSFFNVLNGDFRLVAAPLIILHARAPVATNDGRVVFHLWRREKHRFALSAERPSNTSKGAEAPVKL